MLKFIGTGSAFNKDLVNTSAFLKDEDKLLLIDCGETVFKRALALNLFDDVKSVYIVITHTHSDHIGSLGTLIEYLKINKDILPNIILPNDDTAENYENTIRNYLELTGVSDEDYDFSYGDMMEEAITNLQKIELISVEHMHNGFSYAVELYFNDCTIYYTGDHNDKKYMKNIAKKLRDEDLVYTDCTAFDYKGRIHIMISELEEIFAESQRNQITCMHFENYSTHIEVKRAGFKVAHQEFSKEEILRQIANRK